MGTTTYVFMDKKEKKKRYFSDAKSALSGALWGGEPYPDRKHI